METKKRIVILLTLGLLAAGPGQSAEKPARRISNTRTASCLVKITCDPAILPPDSRAINFLLHSSAVGGKAAREVLDFSMDETTGLFTVEYLQLPASESGATWRRSPKGASGTGVKEDEMDEYEYAMMMEQEMKKRSQSMPTSPDTYPRYGGPRILGTAPTPIRITPTVSSEDEQTYLFGLNISLPKEVKPAAKEFMSILIENLRRALLESYSAYVNECNSQLQFAEDRRDKAQTQLAKAMEQVEAIKVTPPIKLDPADAAVHEQLEQIVDLSSLNIAMCFDEVINELEHSVEPPLQIQPNWKDLLELADLEPTTPSMMDPLTGIKLRKALEVLLAGVSSDSAKVGYVVDEGVIVIATEDTLPKKMVSRVYEIPALAHAGSNAGSLVQAIQQGIEPESWFDLSNTGKGTIGVYMRSKLAILQTDDVHVKIHEFLQSMTTNIPASTAPQIPPGMLLGEKRNLFLENQNIEM